MPKVGHTQSFYSGPMEQSFNYGVLDVFWDLRDDAYDHPESWRGVEAEEVFSRLGEFVEGYVDRSASIDWWGVRTSMVNWRAESVGQHFRRCRGCGQESPQATAELASEWARGHEASH